VERHRTNLDAVAKELVDAANRSGGEDNITVVFFEIADERVEPPAETKPMPVIDDQPAQADEDTLSGLERVPAVDTMVVPAQQVDAVAAQAEPEPRKEHFGVRAARLVVALAIVAALALLVYWLLGQSQ
jgi:hypothetical protein